MKFWILAGITIPVLICGCISLPGQVNELGKPNVPISKGGLTPIGVKKYTENKVGNKTDFIFKLQGNRKYIFLMNFVDETQRKGKDVVKKFRDRYSYVDYDMFVLDADGNILKGSTESAGLGERIVFSPEETNNYTLRILNDRKESKGSWPVFIISAEYYENGENRSIYIKGKSVEKQTPEYETYYALWLKNNPYSLAYIDVPSSLDMYQVRILCIDDKNFMNTRLHLYYDISSADAPDNNRYVSCGTSGEDMKLKLTKGKDCLLQFIGEWGEGELTLNFR